jgi:hypothetical protein
MDIQQLVNSISDLRSDMGRLRGTIGGMDTMLLGIMILLGVNCIATIIIGIAVWNNGG